ncbi:ABC transporter permease [Hydrogenimonas thermophila]|uniref:ABC transporter permease n=1 Tax=Hydrogenimonas thermophila TaxID=223786 RepID=UPI00293741F5|nr:ABC transporter permease [Hydrogenimonas thermophila]WOE68915.1 ABC transporter permease [Hydrogenimonas thermophila]WOE71422.1 ABC transporter permease [Hydrogenimonas thermophila]
MKCPYISIGILISIFLFSFLGPYIYDVNPYDLNPDALLLPPTLEHPFGTDRLGRDLFARLMYGGRVSLIIGVGSALIASMLGLIIGITAGFFKGKVDKGFVILVDLFLTFPTFFLLLALVSYVEASVWVLIFVISVTGWMTMARMIRAESFSISEKPFIKILRIANVNPLKIILKYFAPLLAPIFFVSFTFGVGGAILSESALSFLGLGITPPQMSWGSLISEGKEVMEIAWWISFFPGLMIFLVTFSLMQISDYLQSRTNRKEVLS